MEQNINKKIILSVFIVVGFALFIVAIFIIGGKQNLFVSTFTLQSVFETVSGLKEGSSVRFNGIEVGQVDDIEITGVDKVMIRMTIQSSVREFIKKDSKATVISEGLVGNKIVELTPGSLSVESVRDEDVIQALRPIDTEDILKSLKESGDYASRITKDLSEIVGKVNKGEGTLGQLVYNDQLYRTIDSTMRGFSGYTGQINQVFSKITNTVDAVATDIDQLTKTVKDITGDIAEVTRKMNSSESIVGTLLTDTAFANDLKGLIYHANQTTANLERGSFSFSQNMEALKHNFLFKGYFEDIGYWEKPDWERNVIDKELQLKLKEQQLNEKEIRLRELEEKLNNPGQDK
jgi:phospholipid/cholesterol/gamma-HCH transport system substrate-binding protein